MKLSCDERSDRRTQLLQNHDVNGIDYVEATNGSGIFTVTLHLFQPLQKEDVERIKARNILVYDARRNSEVEIELNELTQTDEFKLNLKNADVGRTYQLRLVELENGLRTDYALSEFDPRHTEVEFTFYENDQPATLVDPQPVAVPPKPMRPDPEINYLAKDYQTFKRLILDRLAKTMPDWLESHAADVGMTLVELLAYTGDQLSYFQDAVATETYLNTARQRISVRRHARLVDYKIGEGANALALVQLQTAADISLQPDQVYFITNPPAVFQLSGTVFNHFNLPEQVFQQVEVFEPIVEATNHWRLKPEDFKDSVRFANRLAASADKLSAYIFMSLKACVRDQVGTCYQMNRGALSEATLKALTEELNRIFQDEDLVFVVSQERRFLQDVQQVKAEQHCCSIRAIVNRAIFDRMYAKVISPTGSKGINCFTAHNEIHFYTWGENECWLEKGATSATLHDTYVPIKNCEFPSASSPRKERVLSMLSAGDILLLEEVKGPKTGAPEDADPHHRQAVRLTEVKHSYDPVAKSSEYPDGIPVVEIHWCAEDALQFPLCISSRTNPSSFELGKGCAPVSNVSVARGNIVLVDHGRKIFAEELGSPQGKWKQINCGSAWDEPRWVQDREDFEPVLKEPDLTAVRSRKDFCAISQLLADLPYKATPGIRLQGYPAVPVTDGLAIPLDANILKTPQQLAQRIQSWYRSQPKFAYAVEDLLSPEIASLLNDSAKENVKLSAVDKVRLEKGVSEQLRNFVEWIPQDDLIESDAEERHFVVEMDNQRRAQLRFGDDEHGHQPDIGTRFFATYRVGNGVAGNVGPGAISRLVTRDGSGTAIISVRNPLPAIGGVDPETIQEVKVQAPHQYRAKQKRAILAKDYEEIVMRNFGTRLQAARAQVTQVGTHWQVDVVIDPLSRERNFDLLQADIRNDLFKYRRMQHRVRVMRGINIPLDLRIDVELKPSTLRSEVFRDLSNIFSSREFGSGRRGLFHADELTFGQPVYVSSLVSAASKVAGIDSVNIPHLSRLNGSNVARGTKDDPNPNASNKLEMGPLEIAQLENQGSAETGKLQITMRGGK